MVAISLTLARGGVRREPSERKGALCLGCQASDGFHELMTSC